MKPQIFVQYCQSIINHEGGEQYTLIGAYRGLCSIKQYPHTMDTLGLDITFILPCDTEALYTTGLDVSIYKNGELLDQNHIEPLEKEKIVSLNSDDREDKNTISGKVQHTIFNLPIAERSELFVRLKFGSESIDSNPLFIMSEADRNAEYAKIMG